MGMYEYRKMTPEQRQQVVEARMASGDPWHAPPHFTGDNTYLLSAACYEHSHFLNTPSRLSEFFDILIRGIEHDLQGTVHAWVVLPNHYHVLSQVDLTAFRKWIARLHNGKSTQWNREDRTSGRKVWHRFSDRLIRNERHYYASLNYIHSNPVKHQHVENAQDWPWCSLHEYLEKVGREQLVEWWKAYPIQNYGKGWDEH